MHPSSLLLVVTVAVLGAAPALANARLWEWPRRDGVQSQPRRMHLPGHATFQSGGDDFQVGFGHHHTDSSFRKTPTDDLNRRITEVQQRCQNDFLLLRRLLEEQGRTLRGPKRGNPVFLPWFFPNPRVPPYHRGQDSDEDGDGDQTNIFLDKPTLGRGWHNWHILPHLPKVPNVDELPDNYDNSTHTIHDLNGTRVEVNTTTNKHTDGPITTFFHAEVFNIIPGKNTPKDDDDDPAKATPTPEQEVTEGDTTTVKPTEEPPVEEETVTEGPTYNHAVPAELVKAEVSMQ